MRSATQQQLLPAETSLTRHRPNGPARKLLAPDAEKEQAEFESEWKDLGRKLEEDRKRQDFLARERQRLLAEETRGQMSKEDEAEPAQVGAVARGEELHGALQRGLECRHLVHRVGAHL